MAGFHGTGFPWLARWMRARATLGCAPGLAARRCAAAATGSALACGSILLDAPAHGASFTGTATFPDGASVADTTAFPDAPSFTDAAAVPSLANAAAFPDGG